MSKGFLWFAQNNDKTDYVELSIKLAESIKKHNKENNNARRKKDKTIKSFPNGYELPDR